MEKSRLNAYLDLVQKLLTCPQGEEWIHLKQHEELVDAEFLQFMEQVAIQIGREGDRSTATFLHNWAAKLHHILLKEIKPFKPEEDKSEAYLNLIEQLLSCPEDMQEQLLIAYETLLGPGLVHALRNVSKQLRRQDENKSAEYLESIATDLSQAWLEEYDVSSPLLKKPVMSASRTPAPYSHVYGIANNKSDPAAVNTPLSAVLSQPIASVQTMTPLEDKTKEDEMDDLWFSSPRAATLPITERSVDAVAGSSLAGSDPSTLGTPSGAQMIAEGLNAIAQALQQLNQTLSSQQPSADKQHPLQHLEILEQACQAEWQLTTEEIEQLLGVKPKCHGNDTTYHRGEWCFTKIGRLGNQTAWRVSKAVV